MGRKKKVGRKKTLTDKQYQKNQLAVNKEWKRTHTKSCNLTLNIDKDSDIITWLETKTNKQEYLKSLIRDDMKK